LVQEVWGRFKISLSKWHASRASRISNTRKLCVLRVYTMRHYIQNSHKNVTNMQIIRLLLKCDGTRAETRFRLSAKRTSPVKPAGASVQSTTGSRGVRIRGSNAGYTMFRGSVKSTGYPLHSPVSPFTSPPARHRVPSHFNWTLPHLRVPSFKCRGTNYTA
jgi:hypothetical protein